MLEKIIASKTRVKLLKLFFLNREKEFYVRELARMTGENLNSVQRELKNLLSAGVLFERPKGNQRLYRVNRLSPVHDELRKLILKTVGLGDALRDGLSQAAGIKYCVIYGSFASGTEIDSSDIDLLIVGSIEEENLLGIIRRLEGELKREINYVLWGEGDFGKKSRERNHLILDIAQKPFIMVIGDADGFRRVAEAKGNREHKG